jgi:subtilisin family serine protease
MCVSLTVFAPGHGTHVSGSIAGTLMGLAPNASIYSVRVLDCTGAGSLADLAAALLWILDNAPAGSIINLSLAYSSYDPTIDSILQKLIANGFTVVAAAGNSATNACFNYPSSSAGVISVAASDSSDNFAYYSNYGSCVTLIAPGSDIYSDWLNNGTQTLSGTSMATAVTSGAVALLLADNPALQPSDVRALLISTASQNQIAGVPSGTPNLLLYMGAATPTPAPATPAPPTPAPAGPRSGPSPAPPVSAAAPRRHAYALLYAAVLLAYVLY